MVERLPDKEELQERLTSEQVMFELKKLRDLNSSIKAEQIGLEEKSQAIRDAMLTVAFVDKEANRFFDINRLSDELKAKIVEQSEAQIHIYYLEALLELVGNEINDRLHTSLSPRGGPFASITVKNYAEDKTAIKAIIDRENPHPAEVTGRWLLAYKEGPFTLIGSQDTYEVSPFYDDGSQQVEITVDYPVEAN